MVRYSSVEGVSRHYANSHLTIKVLDYETLLLDQVMDQAYVGATVTMFEKPQLGRPSAHVVTNEVNLKLGASVIHTLTYSAAMWNQIISSVDPKHFKMMPSEERPKIVLNRVMVCNDLNVDIELVFPYDESLSPVRVGSKVCKAWCCPNKPLKYANVSLCFYTHYFIPQVWSMFLIAFKQTFQS